MADVKFLQDYRGVLTEEQYYTAGAVASFPDGRAAALVQAGRAERVTEASEPAAAVEAHPDESVDFTRVKGVGDSTNLALYNAEILTWMDVLETGVVELAKLDGVNINQARALFAMAQKEA